MSSYLNRSRVTAAAAVVVVHTDTAATTDRHRFIPCLDRVAGGGHQCFHLLLLVSVEEIVPMHDTPAQTIFVMILVTLLVLVLGITLDFIITYIVLCAANPMQNSCIPSDFQRMQHDDMQPTMCVCIVVAPSQQQQCHQLDIGPVVCLSFSVSCFCFFLFFFCRCCFFLVSTRFGQFILTGVLVINLHFVQCRSQQYQRCSDRTQHHYRLVLLQDLETYHGTFGAKCELHMAQVLVPVSILGAIAGWHICWSDCRCFR